jgi:hypothetical protein
MRKLESGSFPIPKPPAIREIVACMDNLFRIIITGQHQCAVARLGRSGVRLFANQEEALDYIGRRLHGRPAKVEIRNQMLGTSEVVHVAPEPTVAEAFA